MKNKPNDPFLIYRLCLEKGTCFMKLFRRLYVLIIELLKYMNDYHLIN